MLAVLCRGLSAIQTHQLTRGRTDIKVRTYVSTQVYARM